MQRPRNEQRLCLLRLGLSLIVMIVIIIAVVVIIIAVSVRSTIFVAFVPSCVGFAAAYSTSCSCCCCCTPFPRHLSVVLWRLWRCRSVVAAAAGSATFASCERRAFLAAAAAAAVAAAVSEEDVRSERARHISKRAEHGAQNAFAVRVARHKCVSHAQRLRETVHCGTNVRGC